MLQQGLSLLKSIFSSPRIVDVLDVLIVAYLLYKLLILTRETRASQVLKGLGVLFAVGWLSDTLGFKALSWIVQMIVNSGAVVVVVLFQPEIRRALESIGSTNLLERVRAGEERGSEMRIVTELITAMVNLARRRVGALIVIEQRTGLKEVIESGTRLDSLISAPLLENIFEPNTPLHDGAVIIRDERIVAAACFLILSEDRAISRELGTRHRAALGISESTDAIALIVSEETGIISLARGGHLTRHLDAHSLEQVLQPIFVPTGTGSPLTALLTKTKRRVRHASE
jgi:diadenylate cyclase